MMGYRQTRKESDRKPQKDDIRQFEKLVRPRAARVNWFSFKEQDKNTGMNKESFSLKPPPHPS